MGMKEKIDHAAQNMAGKAKEALGKFTGDHDKQAEGKQDQASSHAKQAGENVKDAAENVKDAARKIVDQ